jgi:hypothetical protein
MRTGDALLALVIIAVVGLGLFVWSEVFRPRYAYFLSGEDGAQRVMRVNIDSGVPEFMMVDKTTGDWCYQAASVGDAPSDTASVSRRFGGIYSD